MSNLNPMICICYSLWCIIWGIITIYRLWDLYFHGILKKVSFVHWYIFILGEKGMYIHLCKIIMEVQSIQVIQMSWNVGYCGLWILVDTSHYFSHVETVFVGHILINYPHLDFGNWMHYCICAGCGCLILQTLQKLSTCDSEVEVWGQMGSHFIFSFSLYILCLFTHHNDLAKCMSDSCGLW